jgi:hypothetical protein
MIKGYFPQIEEVPDSAFFVTPEIEKKLEAYKGARLLESSKRQNAVDTGESFEASVSKVLNNVRQLLLDKNRKYGNSALEPKRIFSKSDAVEQIKVRIDDKLSRLMSWQLDDTEDVELDLLGYMVLLQVAKKENLK